MMEYKKSWFSRKHPVQFMVLTCYAILLTTLKSYLELFALLFLFANFWLVYLAYAQIRQDAFTYN